MQYSYTRNYAIHMKKNALQWNTIARKYAIRVGNAGVCGVSEPGYDTHRSDHCIDDNLPSLHNLQNLHNLGTIHIALAIDDMLHDGLGPDLA